MKGDLKGIKRIFKLTLAYFRLAVKDFRARRILRDKWRKYVPKYGKRTPEEHEAIRKRIKISPEDCSHLKGGRHRGRYFKDYNVSMHTFILGNSRIICNACQKKWIPESPDWAEALRMVEQSSNFPSRTEVPLKR